MYNSIYNILSNLVYDIIYNTIYNIIYTIVHHIIFQRLTAHAADPIRRVRRHPPHSDIMGVVWE